jgi:cell wall-associated NlpC family hydrolase
MKPCYPVSTLLLLIVIASITGCHSSSRITASSSTARSADAHAAMENARSSSTLDRDRRKVLTEAEQWLGTPYRYGGSTPAGVDCSGFVCNVYRKIDRKLPRSSSQQAETGESISISDSRPGDLIFFNTSGSGVSHVGILINAEQFIHASTSIGVTVSSLNEPYYRDHFMFVRRVLPD